MFLELIKLKESGFLKQMVRVGLMSSKVYFYLEIYMWVDARQRATGRPLVQIVEDAEQQFGKSKSTIWRALRAIKNVN